MAARAEPRAGGDGLAPASVLRYHCAVDARRLLDRSRLLCPCPASSTASSARSCAASPSFQAGDRVRVHFQVVEGTRRRTQVFEGIVHQAPGQRRARDVHGPQAVVRRGGGADVPGPLAEDRAHRGGRARRRAPRQALLPARPRGPRARVCASAAGPGAEEVIEPGLRRGGRDAGGRRAAPGEEELAEAGGRRRSAAPPRRRPRPRQPPAAEEPPAECRRAARRGSEAERRRAGAESRPSSPATTTRLPRRGAGGQVAPQVAGSKQKKRRAHSLVELVTIVAVALGLALGIQAFLVKPFRIPSESMVPTLEVGQRVLVDRVSFRFSDPDRGDILVFKPPAGRRLERVRRRAPERPAVPEGDARALGHELHQARGGPAAATDLKVIDGLGLHQRASARRSRSRGSTRNAAPATCPRRSRFPRATTT